MREPWVGCWGRGSKHRAQCCQAGREDGFETAYTERGMCYMVPAAAGAWGKHGGDHRGGA